MIPDGGEHIIVAFWEVRNFKSGNDDSITPNDVFEYISYSGALLSREEHSIIYAMDRVYRKTMIKTSEYHQNRRNEKQ